jgi:hypothetical protein
MGFRVRPKRKKDKVAITREDLQNMQKASKADLLKISQGLEQRVGVVENLLRLTPREKLRLTKARMRARRKRV